MKVLDKTISQLTVPTPFPVGDTHVYLLKGDTLSLIDAGVKTKEAWEALKTQLTELGYTPHDIEQIILTHHHPDHIGLIEAFPRAETIAAHQNVDLWLTRDEAFFAQYEQFFQQFFAVCGVPEGLMPSPGELRGTLQFAGKGRLTDTLDEGDTLPGHDDWHVIETKGHAQSHLSFLRTSDGVFIGGDHLLHHISPNPLLESPGENDKDRPKPMLQYRANLIKCQSLGIDMVYPGHGDIFSDVNDVIPVRLQKQEQRANKVYQLLLENAQTPYELCEQIFPKQYEKQLSLTMSETIGQLDYLEDEGLVTKMLEDDIYVYGTAK
ncbi:Glyoxylase, beta-lactamase superfamily II [Lentibacillus halodurans]|uniref:Glyoxylase, beta-lactamase superfamily II n=1 Tax=Lentibacillus halodurans TaxID=237679 RepID=A0A1I0V830_9BACI|nr:MBL fold metallo-hydrolase [Lentibacillus halodurans]SFA72519.1 Glyoxylase, beta-lactamase superfamily II [Lentibacillus halodurans]